MIKTMGVQQFDFSDPSPYLLLEAIDDILNYLNQDIIIKDGYAFLNRNEISLDSEFDGTMRKKQYYVNGLLITGLFATMDNEEYFEIEKRFEEMIATIRSLIERILRAASIDSTHSVFVEKDEGYGDIVVGFWKKAGE